MAKTMTLRMSSALCSWLRGASSRTQRPNSASSPELKYSRIMVWISRLNCAMPRCFLEYSGVLLCVLSRTRRPVAPPIRSRRQRRRKGTLTSSSATMQARNSVARSPQCGQSSSRSSSCPKSRVTPHCKSSFDKIPLEFSWVSNVRTASRPESVLPCMKERVIAFFTNSWWYGCMLSSRMSVSTSVTFNATKYSSKQTVTCRLNSLSSAATPASMGRNAGSAFVSPALRRFSGSFVRSSRPRTPALMHL
mmetsp:Transcript_93527/g.273869  ORF Transcript_93527/g.273869 Transcript_93527/m.273869 type:complete len:249 (-) Transcript_93527:563-1309(-)